MSHWTGHAQGYSTLVESAAKAVDDARDHALKVMRDEYPMGASVRVVHHRGEFTGNVTGWDFIGYRIKVRNAWTGRESKWWAAHVEVIGGAA